MTGKQSSLLALVVTGLKTQIILLLILAQAVNGTTTRFTVRSYMSITAHTTYFMAVVLIQQIRKQRLALALQLQQTVGELIQSKVLYLIVRIIHHI